MRNLSVKIENSLQDLDEMSNLMKIVKLATEMSSNLPLSNLVRKLDRTLPTNSFLKYGKGSNHVWVSYRNDRILLITEEK